MRDTDLIRRAVEYIDANLGEELSLYDIAGRAGYSVPHFYRLFKAATGWTVSEFVTKRRLGQAVEALRAGGRTVADIAYECGFGSHDVFTRAFIREYGMPPSRFRKSGSVTMPAPCVAACLPVDNIPAGIPFAEVWPEAFFVTGIRCSAMQWDEDLAIGRLWSAFLLRVEEIEGSVMPLVMMGLCEPEQTSSGRFTYMAAVRTRPGAYVPPGMAVRQVRAQRFVEARIPDRMGVREAYELTITQAQKVGNVVDDYDFIEVFEEVFRDPADHSFALWIPIK